MVESIDNILQIAVLLICSGIAVGKAAAKRSRAWMLLFFACGSWALGDIYWLACLTFFGRVPMISVTCDMNWYAAYIFLYMLLRHTAPPEGVRKRRFLPWLGPLFSMGMAVFFMRWGEILSNLVYGTLMGFLLFSVLRRILDREKYEAQLPLCFVILVFCLLEYAMWISSGFCRSEGLESLLLV